MMRVDLELLAFKDFKAPSGLTRCLLVLVSVSVLFSPVCLDDI